MSRSIFGLMLISVSLIAAFASGQPKDTPIWKPDKKIASGLGALVDLEEFQLNVPKQYQPVKQPGPEGSMAVAWVGRKRSDGTHPSIMVATTRLSSEQRSHLSLENALDVFLAGIEKTRKDWNRTAAERGKVNGVTFVRARWSGTELTTEKMMHGFSYVTIDKGLLVQISSQDVEPYDKETLGLAEAAALTFVKK
jgi:hypothetical protein